jgi:sugar O-acyltransferase (sialic acid O-acetyltransferase NeuD family)
MSKVVIFGTGDFARIAAVYLDLDSDHEVVAFTVDSAYLDGDQLLERPVVAFEELADRYPPDEYAMFVAIGFSKVNEARATAYDRCKALGYELISYVNSKATYWGELDIGDNVFIFEENVIQPFVKIGSDVILWSGNHIGHDTTIGDHCFIASHVVISGNVTVGDRCFIGVNATFRDGVTVAPRCVIGAAAVVMRDTDEGDVLVTHHTEPHRRKSWELRNF